MNNIWRPKDMFVYLSNFLSSSNTILCIIDYHLNDIDSPHLVNCFKQIISSLFTTFVTPKKSSAYKNMHPQLFTATTLMSGL